jgi:hypothetical protein
MILSKPLSMNCTGTPMRECRTYGSVRGVPGDRHPYRDSLVALRCVSIGASRPNVSARGGSD